MISPTPGRIVWFRPNGAVLHFPHYDVDKPLAAIISHVWSDHLVNVAVFDSNGNSHSFTSVTLHQEGDTVMRGGSYYVEWMPYQVGQAKRETGPATAGGAAAL